MPKIILENVTKRWGRFYGVDNFNLVIEDNAFVTLLGPSGCGKTTILRMIAGLETPTSGKITIGDKVVFDSKQGINIPANKRHVGFLFQNYALWPNMTVYQNIKFGLSNIKEEMPTVDQNAKKTDALLRILQNPDEILYTEWFKAQEDEEKAKHERELEWLKDKKNVEKSNKTSNFRYHIAKVDETITASKEKKITESDFVIGIRPEYIRVSDAGALTGEVYSAMPTGMETTVRIRIGNFLITGVVFGGITYKIGQTIKLDFEGNSIVLFSRKYGSRIALGSIKV